MTSSRLYTDHPGDTDREASPHNVHFKPLYRAVPSFCEHKNLNNAKLSDTDRKGYNLIWTNASALAQNSRGNEKEALVFTTNLPC